jgi:lipopolysaccharide/colanic/teichoic acid biosynthesis glycosyltransferase
MAFDRRETALLLIGDFLLLVASLWAALLLRNLAVPGLGSLEANLVPFLPMFCIFLATFYVSGLYEKQTRPIRSVMGVRILGAQIANVVIAAVLFFILPLTIEPKTILVLFLVISVITISLWRFYRMQREIALSARTPAFLVGSGRAIDELFDEINGSSWYRIYFVGRSDVYGSAHIPEAAKVLVVDSYNPAVSGALPALYAKKSNLTILEFAGLYEEIFDRVPLEHIGIDGVVGSLQRRRTAYDVTKRLFDIVLAALGSIIAFPFIVVAALTLLLQGGSSFIRHERIGRGGRRFKILKLRTMLFNDHGDPELQKKNRVTSFGKVLRKARIDELPQLWNVLMSDLSFIGPRPELPTIAEVYDREIPYYALRHLVTPGLSGWAQIHDFDAPRGGADVERTKKKLSFDLYYLKHRSLGLDLAIALKTLRALLSFSGV